MDALSRLQNQAPPGSRNRPVQAAPTALPDRVDLGGEETDGGGRWLGRALAVAGVAVVACTLAGCTTEGSQPVSNGVFTEGYADPAGNYMDGIGAKLGSVQSNGDVYEFLGPYIGHVSDDGSVRGLILPRGYVTKDGTISNGLWTVGHVQGSDPDRVEPIEKAAAALLLLHEK